ncbi:hypothetical protein [uncultured Duncaniella sp.]|uniref:hypothetical protein n=1 Tax=uncultured Duncaniella sp. TaxID=2768039 RepID=UPI0025F55CD4|nr:hypothetical protein [uncultured Duncaniella sp.]
MRLLLIILCVVGIFSSTVMAQLGVPVCDAEMSAPIQEQDDGIRERIKAVWRKKREAIFHDTIICDEHIMAILSIPTSSDIIPSRPIDRYTEGFHKFHKVGIKGNGWLTFHYGFLCVNPEFEDNEMNLYNCRLGNVARSRAFTRDSLFFRQDSYFIYSIDISYENIPEEKRALMDSILDNVKIVSIPWD